MRLVALRAGPYRITGSGAQKNALCYFRLLGLQSPSRSHTPSRASTPLPAGLYPASSSASQGKKAVEATGLQRSCYCEPLDVGQAEKPDPRQEASTVGASQDRMHTLSS